ncbi:MAG: flagellar biosynthesis protein FliQ [Alphaproteobacteria bacterium]|jgi:flagellar biosynthetic protein FliQ|nr:flagellar biosynthesis protein FliQ [Alphaproteobacteria bacterium]
MTEIDAIELARLSIIVALKIGAPIMLLALFVGVAISFLQALTQIQEMTLSFVPKILVIFISMIFLMPYMISTLTDFMGYLAERITYLGVS